MGTESQQLHVFFFPFMAQGHLIPLVDVARLFASRGTKSTIITTPLNALHFAETIDRDKHSGLDIEIQIIPFPAAEVGLPEGCESADSVPSQDMATNFFQAVSHGTLLQQPFEQLLENHRPDCVIADMFLPWTTNAANKYGIPRLVFHFTSLFSLCVIENIEMYAPHKNVTSDAEVFELPGLPDKIKMTNSQLPNYDDSYNTFSKLKEKMHEADVKSFGVLVNSFYELEPAYAEYYKGMGRRAWHIGPVSRCNINAIDKAERGKKSLIDVHNCLSWLNSKEPDSVLYVSFGSHTRFSATQLQHIAMGLEASQVPFIWVVRMAKNKDTNNFLPEGFEERMEGKGLIIKDWAPQVLILNHPSVGGFLTHCGWNSTVEGISAGVPLITWPVFAEQFYNEKLVTQVLKTGITAGNEVWNCWIELEGLLVTKEKIKEVVTQLMDNGQQAQDMRKRARELGEMSKRAVEIGGSSYNDLTTIIEELRVHSQKSL